MATANPAGVDSNNVEKGIAGHNHTAGNQGGYNNQGGGYSNAPPRRRIGNPAPLGLISFASTTLLLSFVNVHARGVTKSNAAVGMAFAVGGLTQLLAGMWEFAAGNTFGATAFSSYGGFWISFGILLTPGFGMIEALGDELNAALALYLSTWFIFTFIMFVASLRSNLGLAFLFFFLDMAFLFLTIGNCFPSNFGITKAGGVFGILAAFTAYYVGTSELCPPGASYFILPTYQLPKRDV